MREITPKVTVSDCSASLAPDGRIDGPINVSSADVTLDEAADLGDDLAGGPVVSVHAWAFGTGVRLMVPERAQPLAWSLAVRAFILPEAIDALHLAVKLLAGRLPAGPAPETYRLNDGQLVPMPG